MPRTGDRSGEVAGDGRFVDKPRVDVAAQDVPSVAMHVTGTARPRRPRVQRPQVASSETSSQWAVEGAEIHWPRMETCEEKVKNVHVYGFSGRTEIIPEMVDRRTYAT